jgi:hypothetical protein
MNTKNNILAAAAVLTVLGISSAASAQQAIFYPPSYSWSQTATDNIPGDVRASVGVRATHRGPHSVKPYGQW